MIPLKFHKDERGGLVAIENGPNCPFEVKRCFYIFDTQGENVSRGAHANYNSQFLLVALSGSCKVMVDDGKEKNEFTLNSPTNALYLNKMVWKEMFEFSNNTVLLVVSSELYDESEYIDSYDDFLKVKNND